MIRRRIVVTGIGAITPIGLDIPQFWEGLISGRNGVTPIEYFDASRFDTQFAAQASGFNPEESFDKKSVKRLDKFSQFAIASSVQAISDSEINLEKINRGRCGVS